MISPYTKYAEGMERAAEQAEALADDMLAAKSISPDAEGAVANAINAGYDNDAADLRAIADAAREAARVAWGQVPADAKFAAAPTPADVAEAYQAAQDAETKGHGAKAVAEARAHADALATEREDAKAEHAGVCRRTTAAFQAIKIAEVPMVHVPTPIVAYDTGGQDRPNGAPGGNGSPSDGNLNGRNGSPSDNSPSTSSSGRSSSDSPLSDSDAGTALSADGSGVPMAGQQLAGQPQQQMMPQQGGAGQPQMAPMAQTGATPTAGAGRLTDPAALAKAAAARNKKRNDGSAQPPSMAPMAFGSGNGTGTSGPIDRGSSINGTTTRADTSGTVKTALSGATLPTGTGQQPAMMRGGGMMGGMGGAGAGGAGGSGGSGGTKERPSILDANRPDEVERSDSVQSGTLSRETANDPKIVEERERGR